MHVADRHLEFHRRSMLDRLARVINQLIVERLFQAVVLRDRTAPADTAWHLRIIEDVRKIEPARFPVVDGLTHLNAVHAPDHFIHGAEAELGHPLAYLFSDEEEKVYNVFRLALEFLA